MSSSLQNAYGYNNSEIVVVRNSVLSKNDDIPFLLLPVKIETRFMKVERSILDPDTFPDVIEGLFEIDNKLRFIPDVLPPMEVLGKIKNLQSYIDEIIAKSSEIQRLSGNNIQAVNTRILQVQKAESMLSGNLSKLRWPDASLMSKLRVQKNLLAQKVQQLIELTSGFKITDETEFTETATFLNKLEGINNSLQNLGIRDISSSVRKEKKETFSFLDAQIEGVSASLRSLKTDMNVNLQATALQLEKLGSYKQELNTLYNNVVNNIKTISSDYKKVEYNSQIARVKEHINAVYAEIDERVIPKIEMKNSLKVSNARDVIVQVQVIRYKLKQLNRRAFRTYDEIRNTRTKLYKQLHALRASVHKIVEGTNDELHSIAHSWDDADAQLEQFNQRVTSYKGNDRIKSGQTRTVTHINEEYRKDLAGLKTGAKSSFTKLSNKTLEKSAVNYTQSIRKLDELQKEIESTIQNPSGNEFKMAMEKLVNYKSSFEIAARDIHILPEKSFQQLTDLSNKIESSLNSIDTFDRVSTKSKTTKSLGEIARSAAERIKAVVEAQYSDAIDRKDRFYDEERTPFVYAQKTVTRDELWIRFYPDDIAIHTHEEPLTPEEVEAGKAYWFEIWAANEDYDARLAAWRAIATAFGSQRAAWIVKTMEPVETELPVILRRIKNISKETTQINDLLERIIKAFLEGGRDLEKRFEVTTEIYHYLISIEKQIKRIKADNVNLLKTTQNLLLKVQSYLNGIIKSLEKIPLEERKAWANQQEIAQNVIYIFNRIVKYFLQIDKLTSRDIIKRETTLKKVFPDVETKEASWTEAPHSKVMPDRFVVVAIDATGNYKYIVPAKPIDSKLIVGLDPETFQNEDTFSYDSDGNLIMDESIKWLTNFDEAEKKGMAVHIVLDEDDLAYGFKKIFVIGVKGSDAVTGKALLEQLIDNHHYLPEGASFLPVNTPTNNTEAGESGYRTFNEDHATSFKVERNNEEQITASDPDFPSDSDRLSEGLGIDSKTLKFLDFQGRTEVSEALNMNKALFPGTLGNFMEEGLDKLFTLDNINHTKAFMTNYVTARGFLPSIRIGTQPYGIMPTTAFSRFHATANDSFLPTLNKEDFENLADIANELQTRFDIRLKQLLELMNTVWTEIREEKVSYSGKTDKNDPQAHFMKMLGLQANSREYFFRYGLNVASRMTLDKDADFSVNFSEDDPFWPLAINDIFKWHMLTGYFYKSDKFTDEQSIELSNYQRIIRKFNRIAAQFTKVRIYKTRYLTDQSQLLGDIIDSRKLSDESIPLTAISSESTNEEIFNRNTELQYYIDWLLNRNAWKVHAGNKFSEFAEGEDTFSNGMPSKSMLFLLLRHSLLSANADAMLKILEHEGIISQLVRKRMGMPGYYYNYQATGTNYVTKWTYLFSKIVQLEGLLGNKTDHSNPFYTYIVGKKIYLNEYLSNTAIFNGYGNPQHQKYKDELEETRTAISRLKSIPTARLQQLMVEHLDLCTYRLDAWMLGMVNKRLSEQRKSKPKGIYLGAYGWVEDLKKGGEKNITEDIPAGLWKNGDDPVYTNRLNQGFIHTPSLNHAITAAILRAGFNANKDTAEVENQMAVNLSSARVRMGLNLLSGIRAGQDAAAILGYQFERGLHERYLHLDLELDKYIYDFRKEFPLKVPVDENLNLEEAQINTVVDGMELLETAQDFIENHPEFQDNGDSIYESLKKAGNIWWAHVNNINLTAAGNDKKDVFLKEIDRLADAFDALGDICISESVYQIAQGNHVRASAIMDKLAKGDVPSEIQITDTPRTGTVVTHKVAVFFETVATLDHELTESGSASTPVTGPDLQAAVTANNARAAGWNSMFTPRAIAEPTLNKWAGELIGDPSKIKCLLSYKIGEMEGSTSISMADLNIQPLDVLHLMGTGPIDGGAELNARIAAVVKGKIAVPVDSEETVDDAEINIKYTQRDNSWAHDEYSFYEKAGLIQSIRKIITDSAAVAADTLLIPGEDELQVNDVKNQIVDEYLIRGTNLFARLNVQYNSLNLFLTDEIAFADVNEHTFTDVQVNTLRSLLNKCASFGVPGTIPKTQTGFDNQIGKTLLAAADGAFKAISKRIKQAGRYLAIGADITKSNDVRIGAIRDAAKELLGKAFIMLPHFALRKAKEITDQVSFDVTKGLLRNAPDQAIDSWMQGLSRVRERIAGLDMLEMWAENFDAVVPEKTVVQFPFAIDENSGDSVDYWLGIEFPDGYTPSEDKLSLVVQNPSQLASSPEAAKAGILIDEWVEIIPNINETSGITFNYDQPDAKAPNTILMAVTPQQTGQWNWDDLVYTLNDTLEMAKNRAVEPEQLEDTAFGQILPGIMNEIVPPQLLPQDANDSGDAQGNPMGRQVITDFRVVNDTYKEEE